MTIKKKYDSGVATRARILLAARKCFAADGFFQSKMTDIESAANTSRGVLYHHFASKDEMIMTIIAENLGSAASKLEMDLQQLQTERKGTLSKLLINTLHVVEAITFGPGKAMSLHVWSLAMLRPDIKKIVMTFFERIQELMKLQLLELQTLGEISREADLNKLATALFSVQIPAYIVQRLLIAEGNSLGPEDFAKTLEVLFQKP